MLSFKTALSLSSFIFIKRLFKFLFTFCDKGAVICVSEVIDISQGNLDSSLCFIQPGISYDVLCISSVQFSSVTQSCPTLCNPMNCSTPGFPVHHQLAESTQTHVHRTGDAIQPSHSLSSPSSPALNPSQYQVLRIRWPKYWSFSFNTSPSNEHPGLISFRMDWLDLLAVQGTLKSLLHHHSSKASILRCLAFFIVHCHIHT